MASLGAGFAACAQAPASSTAVPPPISTGTRALNALSDNRIIYFPSDFEEVYETGQAGPAKPTIDDFVTYVKANLSDQTVSEGLSYNEWMVEYTGPNGQALRWTIGRKTVLAGQWQVVKTVAQAKGKSFGVVLICYQYPDTLPRFNSNKVLEGWVCQNAKGHIGREYRRGDTYNLKSGNIPYILNKDVRPEWPTEVKQ